MLPTEIRVALCPACGEELQHYADTGPHRFRCPNCGDQLFGYHDAIPGDVVYSSAQPEQDLIGAIFLRVVIDPLIGLIAFGLRAHDRWRTWHDRVHWSH